MRAAFVAICFLCAVTPAWSNDFNCAAPGVISTTLGSTPALVSVPNRVAKPPIVLWHGFGPPDTERALMDALPLDALLSLYAEAKASQRLQLTVMPGLAHAWIDTGNVETLRSSIAAWFHTYL